MTLTCFAFAAARFVDFADRSAFCFVRLHELFVSFSFCAESDFALSESELTFLLRSLTWAVRDLFQAASFLVSSVSFLFCAARFAPSARSPLAWASNFRISVALASAAFRESW